MKQNFHPPVLRAGWGGLSNRCLTLTLLPFFGVLSPLAAQDEGFTSVRLSAPTLLNGVLCGKTGGFLDRRPATLYGSGRLRSCALDRTTELHGHTFPAGSWIVLQASGILDHVWLSGNTRLQGHQCRGSGFGGWQTTFHANGSLRTCWLAEPEVIAGVPCRHASFWGELRGSTSTEFHDDGALRSCLAARPFVRDGRSFQRGERVLVDPDGTVRHR
jgi:hypothetical protein